MHNAQDMLIDNIVAGLVPSTSTRIVAPSLRPDDKLTMACAVGHPVAREIASAWRFSFPVRTLSSEALEELMDTCNTLFSEDS